MPGTADQDISLRLVTDAASSPVAPAERRANVFSRKRLPLFAAAFGVADVLTILGAGHFSNSLISALPKRTGHEFLIVLALISTCVIASFWERGIYSASVLFGHTLQLRRILLAWVQAVGLALLLTACLVGFGSHAWSGTGLEGVGVTLESAWLPTFVVIGLIGLTATRLLRLKFQPVAAMAPDRAVVIGTTELCQMLVDRLRRQAAPTLTLLGVVEHLQDPPVARRSFCDLPVLGEVDTLIDMIRRDEVDKVLVALPWSDAKAIRAILSRISVAPVDVYLVPGLEGFELNDRQITLIAGVPVVQAINRPLGGWHSFVKRTEDLVLGGLLLALAAPAMLGIAAMIKMTSPGPVLFCQRRLGFNNRIIGVFKFRTMYAHLTDADARQQSTRNDPRVTRVGAWLRRSSMDELPQLLNVIMGNMSLVGPRPHALQTTAGGMPLEDVVPVYSSRHRVKPGMTGWAQVNGYRGALDTVDKIVQRVNHDLYYIENWSLAFDLKILWRTVLLVLADNNAF